MKATTPNPPPSAPEFAVRRETISKYFDPPLPRSTFHDFVNKGSIIPMKGVRGFYLLNASLRRLGLKETSKLPETEARRTMEDILRLAFTFIDEGLFPAPSWLLDVEELSMREVDHASRIANEHRNAVEQLDSDRLKLAYFAGVLDGQRLIGDE